MDLLNPNPSTTNRISKGNARLRVLNLIRIHLFASKLYDKLYIEASRVCAFHFHQGFTIDFKWGDGHKFLMNAWQMPQDIPKRILAVNVPNLDYKRRLKDLGFDTDEWIICVKFTPFSGPKVYQNSNGVFSLDQQLAEAIEVTDV